MFNKPKLLTYKEFATRLHEKLVEYNYTFGKYRNVIYYELFFYDNDVIQSQYVYFRIIDSKETIEFVDNEECNPLGCWHGWSSPKYFTEKNLNDIIDKVKKYAIRSKQCKVNLKLASIKKDFK